MTVQVEGDGPPVLLLHGFPDSHQLWRHQVPVLAKAGYRVIAPDLRGFGDADRPDAVADYAVPRIAGDMAALLDSLDVPRAAVVGHDWGAGVAWAMAMAMPDRVERLAVLSVGHPASFYSGGIEQLERSWYMLFFLHKGVAEQALRRDDWKLFREWLRNRGDIDRYLADLDRPGALTAALNWYRANIRPERFGVTGRTSLPPITCPVMGIWSTGDRYCLEPQMQASAQYVTGPWRYERIEGASHWIPLDAPDRLNELLLDFLS